MVQSLFNLFYVAVVSVGVDLAGFRLGDGLEDSLADGLGFGGLGDERENLLDKTWYDVPVFVLRAPFSLLLLLDSLLALADKRRFLMIR